MWYPHILLTRRIRIAIMCTLIASFCIVSPLVILYTAGYRFDIRTRTISETGVLAIDVIPKNAHVVINDIDITLAMPIRLANRIPGTYHVMISQTGYLPWDQSVRIESTQTTYITNLYLFLNVLPTFEYAIDEDTDLSSFSPDASTVLTTSMQEGGIYDITQYTLSTDETHTLWRGGASTSPHILWSHHAPLVAILAQDTLGQTTIQTTDMSRTDSTQDYTLSPSIHPTSTTLPTLQWHEHGNATLYVKDAEAIRALSNRNERTLFTTTSSVWFVDSNEDVWHINQHQLYKNTTLITAIDTNNTILEIIDTRTSNVIVRTSGGIGILWLDSGEITVIPGDHILPRTYGKSWSTWIVWSEWEVSEILENGNTRLLTRTNEPIQDVGASPKHEVLFFVFPHKIIAFHPEFRTTHVLFENSSGAPIHHIATDSDNTFIIFDTSLNDKRGVFKRML